MPTCGLCSIRCERAVRLAAGCVLALDLLAARPVFEPACAAQSMPSTQPVRRIEGAGLVETFIFSADSKTIYSLAQRGGITFYNVADGKNERFMQTGVPLIPHLALSPDGKTLAAGGSYSKPTSVVELWDLKDAKCIRRLRGEQAQVSSVSFSPDGARLAAVTMGYGERTTRAPSRLTVWDLATGTPVYVVRARADQSISRAAYNPSGKVLAVADTEGAIALCNPADGTEVKQIQAHKAFISHLRFASTGVLVSAGLDPAVKLWDVDSGKLIRSIDHASGPIYALALAPSGRTMASANGDRTVKLWDLDTGRILRTLSGHTRLVNALAFSPDGKLLASLGEHDVIYVWDVADCGTQAQSRPAGTQPAESQPAESRPASGSVRP